MRDGLAANHRGHLACVLKADRDYLKQKVIHVLTQGHGSTKSISLIAAQLNMSTSHIQSICEELVENGVAADLSPSRITGLSLIRLK